MNTWNVRYNIRFFFLSTNAKWFVIVSRYTFLKDVEEKTHTQFSIYIDINFRLEKQ